MSWRERVNLLRFRAILKTQAIYCKGTLVPFSWSITMRFATSALLGSVRAATSQNNVRLGAQVRKQVPRASIESITRHFVASGRAGDRPVTMLPRRVRRRAAVMVFCWQRLLVLAWLVVSIITRRRLKLSPLLSKKSSLPSTLRSSRLSRYLIHMSIFVSSH